MEKKPEQSKPASALKEWFRNFGAGTMAGMLAKIVEYPLDTVKVRLQSMQGTYTGTFDCVRKMWTKEGFISFYNGLPSPLVGCMMENAFVFSVYGQARRMIRGTSLGGSMYEVAIAGGFAGFAAALIATPVELIKCRMQAQPHLYKSSIECLRATVKSDGLFGLTRGFMVYGSLVSDLSCSLLLVNPLVASLLTFLHNSTFGREVPGTAVWFSSYEGFLRYMAPADTNPTDLPLRYHLAGGALGGVAYWTVPFPFDVVKSQVQTYAGGKSYAEVVKSIWRTNGLRGFYDGLPITLLRAVPANAVIFGTYSVVYRLLSSVV